MEFSVIQGDIAQQEADALVNAAGTSLRMGSGVAGALRRAANGPINDEAMSKGPVELGEVAVTDAYDLAADYVIHAAARPHYWDGRATLESTRAATRNTLKRAEELGCRSLAIPVPGTDATEFDLETGAQLICEELWQYESRSVADIDVIAYSAEEYEIVREIADRVRP